MSHKVKRYTQLALILSLVVFLGACSMDPISSESTGIWDRYIVYNLSLVIEWFSKLFGNNPAFGIITFTIIIRLLMMPLMIKQMKSQRQMAELQPELQAIQEKYPGRDQVSMELMQEEQQALYDKHDVNQFAGCLPMLVQLPIMMALYQVILRTDSLRVGEFLWTNLGQKDPYFILPILAAGLTFASTYLSMKSNPVQNSTTKIMMYAMPLMILFVSVSLPTAVVLYWVVSNAITVIQTLVFNNPYKIIAEREAKEQAEKERERRLRRELKRARRR